MTNIGIGYFEITLRDDDKEHVKKVISKICYVIDNMTVIDCGKPPHTKLIGTDGCIAKAMTAGINCRLTFAEVGKAVIVGTDAYQRDIVQKRLKDKVSEMLQKTRKYFRCADASYNGTGGDERSVASE